MTPLRQRMTDAVLQRGYATSTQANYVKAIYGMAKYYWRDPAQYNAAEVQAYLLHMVKDRHVSFSSMNQTACAARFLYETVLGHDRATFHIPMAKAPVTQPELLSREEIARLFATSTNPVYRMMLQTIYATGLRVFEACALRVRDIDSAAERLAQFRVLFDEDFWTSVPPIAGAVEACLRLHDHSYELVCVSAIDEHFVGARLNNLRDHGFPIERVFGTGNQPGQQSPKAQIIDEIKPVAFVDDYLPYMSGIRSETHTALILRQPNGSPNVGPGLAAVGYTHADLAAFSDWWLART